MTDETQPQDISEVRRATQPQILNIRLRELYAHSFSANLIANLTQMLSKQQQKKPERK